MYEVRNHLAQVGSFPARHIGIEWMACDCGVVHVTLVQVRLSITHHASPSIHSQRRRVRFAPLFCNCVFPLSGNDAHSLGADPIAQAPMRAVPQPGRNRDLEPPPDSCVDARPLRVTFETNYRGSFADFENCAFRVGSDCVVEPPSWVLRDAHGAWLIGQGFEPDQI